MADRKAINKYYPPDWDPSKGSVNRYNNTHHLRDRARKIDEGILIVRFELPFNIWCSKCENHIGMGVRYNAEKSRNGSYYSTPIYKFEMKCHLCDNHFVIQTDPSKFDYTILSGARRQVRQTEDTDDTRRVLIDTDESRKRTTDAMFRLEKKLEDKLNAEAQEPSLVEIQKWKSRYGDSFTANQIVRRQYRERRKNIEANKAMDRNLLKRASLDLPLAEASSSDRTLAREMFERIKGNRVKSNEVLKKQSIIKSAIMSKSCDIKPKIASLLSCKPASSKIRRLRDRAVTIKKDPN